LNKSESSTGSISSSAAPTVCRKQVKGCQKSGATHTKQRGAQRGTPLQATPGDLSVEVNGSHARRWRSRAARYRPARSESLASTVRSLVSAAVVFAGAGKLAVTTPSTWALPLARIPLTALGIRVDGMPHTIRQVR